MAKVRLTLRMAGKLLPVPRVISVTMPAPPAPLSLPAQIHSGRVRVPYTLVTLARARLPCRTVGKSVVVGISSATIPSPILVPPVTLLLPARIHSGKVLVISALTGAHLTLRMVGKLLIPMAISVVIIILALSPLLVPIRFGKIQVS